MKVTIHRPSTGAGFFPGLAKPTELDSSALAPADAAELERLARAALELAPPEGPPTQAEREGRDFQALSVVIETAQGMRTFSLSDLAAKPGPLKNLISFVETKARELTAAGRSP
jgi:hypothetical protein